MNLSCSSPPIADQTFLPKLLLRGKLLLKAPWPTLERCTSPSSSSPPTPRILRVFRRLTRSVWLCFFMRGGGCLAAIMSWSSGSAERLRGNARLGNSSYPVSRPQVVRPHPRASPPPGAAGGTQDKESEGPGLVLSSQTTWLCDEKGQVIPLSWPQLPHL